MYPIAVHGISLDQICMHNWWHIHSKLGGRAAAGRPVSYSVHQGGHQSKYHHEREGTKPKPPEVHAMHAAMPGSWMNTPRGH